MFQAYFFDCFLFNSIFYKAMRHCTKQHYWWYQECTIKVLLVNIVTLVSPLQTSHNGNFVDYSLITRFIHVIRDPVLCAFGKWSITEQNCINIFGLKCHFVWYKMKHEKLYLYQYHLTESEMI